jgi:CheY-like chemotaxis protein
VKDFDLVDFEHGYGNRFQRFQDLMRHRIHDILLVSSMYDSFILAEDGRLHESLVSEYLGLNLTDAPGITRVSSAREAVSMVRRENRFNLVICSLRMEDMDALEFARSLRKHDKDVPLVLLTYDYQQLSSLMARLDFSIFDKVFVWQGDFRILLTIIKLIEDKLNVRHDTELVGVQSIILIEDNVRFYSSYLPIIYTELMRHSQELISEGVNPAHRLLRRRARPKILHCVTYEEAWDLYSRYHQNILGVVSDIQFPRKGESDPHAGLELARNVKEIHPDIPILLQSHDPSNQALADEVGASFLLKNSATLLEELRRFMISRFSFGDFVFLLPDGSEVGRAHDLRSLEKELARVPAESLLYHGERNDFSNWLKARTEFLLAYRLRPQKVSDYDSIEDMREYLINSVRQLRLIHRRGIVVDFDPATFDPSNTYARIGGGSLGGKGRGLAFVNTMVHTYLLHDRFEAVDVSVPPMVILGTEVFERFIRENELLDLALTSGDDGKIERRFLSARLPDGVVTALRSYLELASYPLAVRSSGLLEDSQFLPFAGVYRTYMLPNNHADLEARLEELTSAVKRVYASTYSKKAKAYIRATPYRLEEEKMAVIVQKMVGQVHENRFYPAFSGVANSHNFYPVSPMKPSDGIVSMALGLGPMVLEGGKSLRFCPKYPERPLQFSTVDEMLKNSQKSFFALGLPDAEAQGDHRSEFALVQLGLDVAEQDGMLGPLASTYSHENHRVSDGISRVGVRIVSFASVLKQKVFPLAEILQLLMRFGSRGMGTDVEIEFAVNLPGNKEDPVELGVLQMRPMVISREPGELTISESDPRRMLCKSRHVLGHGLTRNIHDIVYVDFDRYDRAASHEVAQEVARFNSEMSDGQVPYLLIGVGRWGTADPWLGIPVDWESISGARVIVEAGFKDMPVTPSQGTHIFHNLISFQVGYFTVNSTRKDEFVDWNWLGSLPAVSEGRFTRHVRLERPLVVQMDGRRHKGVILKPDGA